MRVSRERKFENARDQRIIRQSAFRCRARELALALQIAIRIDLDHEDLALLGHAQIDTRIVTQSQRVERLDCYLLHTRRQLGREVDWEDRARAGELLSAPRAVVAPLRLPARNARYASGKSREIQFHHRQCAHVRIAENADVKLPSLHELLDEHGLLEFRL